MAKTKQPEPEATAAAVKHAFGLAALTVRALDGDVDAMIWFLSRNGGPEWQLRGDDESARER